MKRYYPWLFAGLITLIGCAQVVLVRSTAAAPPTGVDLFGFMTSIAFTAFMGALITDRRPGNRTGRLVLAVAFVTALPVFYDPAYGQVYLDQAPENLTPGIWLLVWFQSWFWLLQIITILQIALQFPDGELPSKRWRWTRPVSLGVILLAALIGLLAEEIGPIDSSWRLDNPLGILPRPVFDGLSLLWVLGLLALAVAGLASLVVRYRRRNGVVRAQIRWLLFAGTVVIAVVTIGLIFFSTTNATPAWLNTVFQFLLLVIPLAIANAILRYRLYEIDIIIRRTLSYTLLTSILGLVYFGGVILLQAISGSLFGRSDSPIITVITTLAIAALFNPLRNRVQSFIDRRFFRRKYDTEKALANFASIARDEVDLFRLTGSLLGLLETTLQPENLSLWLREPSD